MKKGFLLGCADGSEEARRMTAPPMTQDNKFTLDHFNIDLLVGVGNFCEVFHVFEKGTGKDYALKIVNRKQLEMSKKEKDALMERHCLLRLSQNHPNIIKLYGTFKDNSNLYFVYEYCNEGELWNLVYPLGLLNEEIAKHYLTQLINAIEFLHANDIVHRDIKAENMMLHNGVLKLIDFGTAYDLRGEMQGAGNCSRGKNGKVFEHYVGTPNILPPEAIKNLHTDKRNDLWSLGCAIYQIISGEPPFSSASEYLTYCRALDLDLSFPPGFPKLAEDLVRNLVKLNPDERLGARQGMEAIKKHPYFADSNFSKNPINCRPMESLSNTCLRTCHKFYPHLCFNDPNTSDNSDTSEASDKFNLRRWVNNESNRQFSVDLRNSIAVGLDRIDFFYSKMARESEVGYWEKMYPQYMIQKEEREDSSDSD